MTPKQSVPMGKQYYTVDFNEFNWAFKDLRTGEPPTGLYAAGDSSGYGSGLNIAAVMGVLAVRAILKEIGGENGILE